MSAQDGSGSTRTGDGAAAGLVRRAGRDLRRLSDSYGLVFLLIVATLLSAALASDARWGRALTTLLMGATLLLTFSASRAPRRSRAAAVVVVAALLVVAVAATQAGDGAVNRLLGLLVGGAFVLAATVAVVRRLRSQTAITMRTVMGALCVYLFIGFFFDVVYSAVDIVESGHFFAQTDAPTGLDFVYFSFITQATVGYGDLSPATDLGRMLAVTQALLGQVYLVTIVAALVGNLGRTRPAEARERGAGRHDEPDGHEGPEDDGA